MKIKLGSVGVDSGQLMVTDPCYVKMFKNNEFDPKTKFYDSKKDKTLVYPDDFKNFEDDIIEGYNKNMNTLIKEKIFDEVKEKSNDKSYSFTGACSQTLYNENLGGEIGNGLGLSFATGYGDGCYPIYAHYDDDGWGKRITQIEIVFINDEEFDDDDAC